MKNIVYILSIVLVALAGIFSYKNWNNHKCQIKETKSWQAKVVDQEGKIAYLKGERHDPENEPDGEYNGVIIPVKDNLGQWNLISADSASNQDVYDAISKPALDLTIGAKKLELVEDQNRAVGVEIGNKEDDKRLRTRELDKMTENISAQEKQITKTNDLIKKIEEAFGEFNVTIDQVPQFIRKLKKDLKDKENELEILRTNVDGATNTLDKNNAKIDEFNTAQGERVKRLGANLHKYPVTAVDSDWGFIVARVEESAELAIDETLIVVRGGQMIGRVRISALEKGKVIADIDYDSLQGGKHIHAGDKLILEEVKQR